MIRLSCFTCFLFFTQLSLFGQKINCGSTNSIYKKSAAQNIIPCDTNESSGIFTERACIVKDFEQTYDYGTKNIKYVPIVFHIIQNIDDQYSTTWFDGIEDRILIHLSGANQDFAGLTHLDLQLGNNFINSLYQAAVENTIDTKIRFVLANKDPDGNTTNSIIKYNLTQEQYDSLFHAYEVGFCGDTEVTQEFAYPYLDINVSPSGSSSLCKFFWDTNNYMNVFIFKHGHTSYSGYAHMLKTQRAITINTWGFNYSSNTNRYALLTHELGHMLDLMHTHYWDGFYDPPELYPYSPHLIYDNLDVCNTHSAQLITVFAPDNTLFTTNTYRDIPENIVKYDVSWDNEEPELHPDAHLLYGYNNPNFPYYTDVNLDETNTLSDCISPFNIQTKYYSPDFNFMSYNTHGIIQFSPHQILRMHCMLENYYADNDDNFIADIDHNNLWSHSSLLDLGILKGPNDNTPLQITNTVTYHTPVTIAGEVIIKNGGTLILNDDLKFLENGCLTVETGGQLSINTSANVNIYNEPYKIWLDKSCSATGTFQFQMRALLEGYYNQSTAEMNTELQTLGLLPFVQPFNTAPWNYNGTETVVGHSANTSDWVLLRLHDDNGTIVQEQAALINKFGYVTTTTGNHILKFNNATPNQTYSVSIHPRGHLAVIAPAPYGGLVDFTRPDVADGIEQTKDIGNIEVLYSGDFDGNGINNNIDFNKWALNNVAIFQYLNHDADGNGIVNNLDFNLWKINNSKVGDSAIQY